MAYLSEHMKDCVERLGEPFEEVHRWLDEYAEKYPVKIFGEQHRKYRHHQKGVEEVRQMWGDRSAEAAILHIVRDEFGPLPKNEQTLLKWKERLSLS